MFIDLVIAPPLAPLGGYGEGETSSVADPRYLERVTADCQVLLVSGSLRSRSTNTALLRTAQLLAPPGVTPVFYEGMEGLPHFNPDHDAPPLHPAVADLRGAIRASAAILFSTPEYAGALPGSFKNLLDWTIGDEQAGSIYEKPVAWVNVSAAPTGATDAYESLRKVLAYAHASVVEAACTPIPVTRQDVDGGIITDPIIRAAINRTVVTLAAHANR
jgi:chromate reductase, NAD(P)H dehydrogenase (quinone)